MKTAHKVLFRCEMLNLLRGKWLWVFAALLVFLTQGLLQFGADTNKLVVSLMNIILYLIPLISILVGVVGWYNSDNFTKLILTQPVRRNWVFVSRWLAYVLTLSGLFSFSVGGVLLANGVLSLQLLILLILGVVLNSIFVSLGFLIALLFDDKAKAVGLALSVWLYFIIVHDGLLFLGILNFYEYPLEVPALLGTAVNPIGLSRMVMLFLTDITAMMGYTGLLIQRFVSGGAGIWIPAVVLVFWLSSPVLFGLEILRQKDF